MEEPSVLDYVKALLTPWRGKPPQFPAAEPAEEKIELEEEVLEPVAAAEVIQSSVAADQPKVKQGLPWRSMLAVVLAIGGQLFLEPPGQSIKPAIFFYIAAAGMLLLAIYKREWLLPEQKQPVVKPLSTKINLVPTILCVPLIILAFLSFTDNTFTILNLALWLLAIGAVLWALLLPVDDALPLRLRIQRFINNPTKTFTLNFWTFLMIAAIGLVAFFRFYRLSEVPGEMFSDQAEKLLDVGELLLGKTSIFFPRNTGREAFQMYLTAAVAIIFKTGLSFMSLKIGTALAGFFTLPFIYKLGKELGNKWVGLAAFFLAGVAYWPNVISRIGLRFPLYPLFVAPTLYYLIRGLRNSNRNDFIWTGIFLGIGLHGYSPIRFLPFVVIAAIGIYLLHRISRGNRVETIYAFVALAFASFVVFLPLFRYAIENPDMFGYRAFTRLGTSEAAYPNAVWLIFLENLWKSSIMFFYSNGNIWVHSVPNRPALDVITAALYFIGVVLLIVRYIRQRNWEDLFLLVSVPLLMMPSILSLAFPEENPSLNRSGGAVIPVFIIAAIGAESFISTVIRKLPGIKGKLVSAVIVLTLLLGIVTANFDLVFRQFDQQFMGGAWNTSEIGKVIRSFADSVGNSDTAYVVPYPYWVDTRLVGINAGYPFKDYALWPENFSQTLAETRAQLFVLNPQDSNSLEQLQTLYPEGTQYYYDVALEGKDFLLFFVPPR